MKLIRDSQTFRCLLKQYVPVFDPSDDSHREPDRIAIYLQDISANIDFYILSWNPAYDEFFTLVDPLHCGNVLDLEYVPISFPEDSLLFCIVYPPGKQIHWKVKYRQLLKLKCGIPSSTER